MDENKKQQIAEIKAAAKKWFKSFLLNVIWMAPLAIILNCIFGQENVFRYTLLLSLVFISIITLKWSIENYIETRYKSELLSAGFSLFLTIYVIVIIFTI